MAQPARCPSCGTELTWDPGTEGLCPQCLLTLALEHDAELRQGLPREGPAPGRILGDRYEVRELLGRGGMGEVWRAFDLKLRVDVALKAVRPEKLGHENAAELLRREVRAAREIVSPHVCRIFDLVVEDGQELVSMELVDGTTLAKILRERGPLALQEAREISAQFLAGLEAVHQAGLVHRDFKPENVMITRSGRVVVMDLGLAKERTGETRSRSGTPAYMAPEQARGEDVDVRADVFSAGIVLAEMTAVGGNGGLSREALWEAARRSPPDLPESPWAPVLRKALHAEPEARYASARALALALEEVTLRVPGFKERHPFPGLTSFTEDDSDYFFGREAEVEELLKKLQRPRLLAVIGPSGAGKTSFLRAGVLPALPESWSALVVAPGRRPLRALVHALLTALGDDRGAVEAPLRSEDEDALVALVQSWRARHEQALIALDPFEELFVLSSLDVQHSFARLLGRLVLEADVHVLLCLRDDFLVHCHRHKPLFPMFSDLMPLGALDEMSLRRALVLPALACGYRFEDEALVEEMVREVKEERGVLPLLAFAASRLWERRDRERGLMTREAYREIGGVAGALARHAEATLEKLGAPRASIVREVFRNLVTAQGTRAARERGEILSVFDAEKDRKAAEEVLDALIGARLLTCYEPRGEDQPRQEIEVVHESLLSHWPRLVRWQTQDADGAQLRDQLRQAARTWDERGRPGDLLWSGAAYRDLAVWRERYPGRLSATEEAFAQAASALAGRQRRRGRLVVATVVAALSIGLGVVASLWGRAETARHNAESEALRAEASKILALGQLELESYPTAAVAYALKSLELSDTREGRLFALRALQRGPTARLLSASRTEESKFQFWSVAFSPNGEWLANADDYSRKVELRHRDGGEPIVFADYPAYPSSLFVGFGPKSDVFATDFAGELRIRSVPDGRDLHRARSPDGATRLLARGAGLFTATTFGGDETLIRYSPFAGGAAKLVGSMESAMTGGDAIDAAGARLAYPVGRKVYVRALERWSAPPRLLGEHPADLVEVTFSPDGERLAASDKTGTIRIWSTRPGRSEPERLLRAEGTPWLRYDPKGRWLAAAGAPGGQGIVRLWDLQASRATEPLVLRKTGESMLLVEMAFEPSGRWLATMGVHYAAFWPLGGAYPRVLTGHQQGVASVAFTPDGSSLVSLSLDGEVRLWPLASTPGEASRVVVRTTPSGLPNLVIDPTSRFLGVGTGGGVLLAPLAGGPARTLSGFSQGVIPQSVAFSPDGQRVAAAPNLCSRQDKVIRVWDLGTSSVRVIGPLPGAGDGPDGAINGLVFLDGDRLLAGSWSAGGVLCDLRDGTMRVMATNAKVIQDLSRRRGYAVGGDIATFSPLRASLFLFRLDGGDQVVVTSHGLSPWRAALDPTGRLLASGSSDGIVRIGLASGEEPHHFFGHQGAVYAVAFSPDGRWLASAGDDKTIRLWPVPDASKPPFHTLPRDELLAKLRAFTNLRVVTEGGSASGYRLETGPFPGWANAPQW